MTYRAFAIAAIVAAFLACAGAAPAGASPSSDAFAVVTQYFDDFNAGKMSDAVALCAPSSFVVDEFAPHTWGPANGCGQWARAFAAFAKAQGITNPHVTLGTPSHADVTGKRAYVVVPATFSYTAQGKPGKESDARFTAVLQNTGGAWRIAAWTWSQGH